MPESQHQPTTLSKYIRTGLIILSALAISIALAVCLTAWKFVPWAVIVGAFGLVVLIGVEADYREHHQQPQRR